MSQNQQNSAMNKTDRFTVIQNTCKKIAPLWSLENFVAVNPYLGFSDVPFEQAAHKLSQLGGISMTLPISFYLEARDKQLIRDEDVEKAILHDLDSDYWSLDQFQTDLEKLSSTEDELETVELVVDAAREVTGKDWSSLLIDRISSWASAYFDEGQALWETADKNMDIYSAWRSEALIDKTPEYMGLKGFRAQIKDLPEDSNKAIQKCLDILNIPDDSLELYLHSLLLQVGGWSSYVAKLDWDSNLNGQEGKHLQLFLINLICWETALYKTLEDPKLRNRWAESKYNLSNLVGQNKAGQQQQIKLILQQAFDNANQRDLIETFSTTRGVPQNQKTGRADVQAVFCIDVRSEVFRRNFEMVSPTVETIGFAGFFGFPISYQPIGHEEGQAQCPVLIAPGPSVKETIAETSEFEQALTARKLSRQLMKAWKSFKLGAISCFSFMGPVGLAYLFKMFTDAFGRTRPVKHPDQKGFSKAHFNNRDVSLDVETTGADTTGITMEDQVGMAKGALNAMSLTKDFARIVLIAGHGSNTVNNPHATGLDCGACGGRTGEANAKVAAKILNNPEVRTYLKKDNIHIPEDTLFIAGLHDTTTDDVTLYNVNRIPKTHENDLEQLKTWLKQAGHTTRVERAARFNIDADENVDKAIFRRSKDWSEVRPEWGLAGCNTFIVAQRERTEHMNLGGKSFLHNYDWQQDEDFSILELIMTAPMVVTSWINLQYYASTVDNRTFGSGNKTLHNITAGIGVLEGYSGDLRTGLPWQSVHDGDNYQHLPQRLNVVIEAPTNAMNAILENHTSVKDLCDNGWINLLAMNEEGQIHKRYTRDCKWATIEQIEKEMVF